MHSLKCHRLNLKFKLCRKTAGSQDAEAILGKAFVRISDGTYYPFLKVFHTAVGIDDIAVPDIDCHGVDSEIPTLKILVDIGAVCDAVRMA